MTGSEIFRAPHSRGKLQYFFFFTSEGNLTSLLVTPYSIFAAWLRLMPDANKSGQTTSHYPATGLIPCLQLRLAACLLHSVA